MGDEQQQQQQAATRPIARPRPLVYKRIRVNGTSWPDRAWRGRPSQRLKQKAKKQTPRVAAREYTTVYSAGVQVRGIGLPRRGGGAEEDVLIAAPPNPRGICTSNPLALVFLEE